MEILWTAVALASHAFFSRCVSLFTIKYCSKVVSLCTAFVPCLSRTGRVVRHCRWTCLIFGGKIYCLFYRHPLTTYLSCILKHHSKTLHITESQKRNKKAEILYLFYRKHFVQWQYHKQKVNGARCVYVGV